MSLSMDFLQTMQVYAWACLEAQSHVPQKLILSRFGVNVFALLFVNCLKIHDVMVIDV